MGVDFRAIALFSGWVIFLVLPLTLVIRATVESKYVLGGSPRSQTSAKWITLCIVVAALKLSEKIMPSRWEPQRHIMGNVVIFLVSLDVLSWDLLRAARNIADRCSKLRQTKSRDIASIMAAVEARHQQTMAELAELAASTK